MHASNLYVYASYSQVYTFITNIKCIGMDSIYIYTYIYIYIYIHIYIYIYLSGYGKYSDPLKFFTLCYIAAIC